MNDRMKLPLPKENSPDFYFTKNRLILLKDELEQFLDETSFMKSRNFSNDALFSYEIKFNNIIEGYNDDLHEVNDIVIGKDKIINNKQKTRINNLYLGYKFINTNPNINKDNLRHLYNILSKNLLSKNDIVNTGRYYRNNEVYIHYSNNPAVSPQMGVSASKVNEYMDYLLNYIENVKLGDTMTDEFIKSQIIHFYFVYVHPYFDVNGRTSRTLSMWYLLNKQIYPYIIFNRAIPLELNKYYEVIRDVRKYRDVSFFIKYMLENVLVEIEKEYVIHNISEFSNIPLSKYDRQTLHYILSMSSLKTVNDFRAFYNRFNPKMKSKELYQNMIEPLIDTSILLMKRKTSSKVYTGQSNFEFEINPKFIDDSKLIKKLKI